MSTQILRSLVGLSLCVLSCLAGAQVLCVEDCNDALCPDFWNARCERRARIEPDNTSTLQNITETSANHDLSSNSSVGSRSVTNRTPANRGPVLPAILEGKPRPVEWKSLMRHSNFALGVMHGFRIATEPSTRLALHNRVFGGYSEALGAMHGWSDGDGYYENYLGHPLQGAASGYLWIEHDPRYRFTEFGRDRDYWMSRLRAFGYAWGFSEQFEVGLLSEATIGQIQRYCCAYGFVDHVITPTAGFAWMVGEDIIDKYIVRQIENRTRHRGLRMIARVGLNPPLTFANLMAFRAPWHRTNRPGIRDYDGELYLKAPTTHTSTPPEVIPKFELAAELPSIMQWGRHSCVGGGVVGAFQLAKSWQWTLQVGGCMLQGLPKNWSGDSLTFTTGPQWIMHTSSRWSPHAHFRFGGQKLTEEYRDPAVERAVASGLPTTEKLSSFHDQYARDFEATGAALSVGGGIDLRLTRAVAVRVANIDYVPTWMGSLNGATYSNGVRFSTGFILRVGTW